ncbi:MULTISPECIES: hypothetical protein [unclassified Sphingobium]|uniref:hypothetical protein n=1 Tax=unclassified Sphingobium TaxID=2611147 RepID=UPI00222436C0|nr:MULTISPECIES: hypothetical protein [unclassified Sphingobium]MCW2396650.1 hypothetical protein [Sphingobium sp. B8D3B]MCW2420167.1 hypothetical protein [Sphingobium sp. B8D3C]
MSKLTIELGGGLRGLPLGSSRGSVRAFFGNGHQPFKRSADSEEADYWSKEGVFAYYDDAELLEALEFSKPSDPTLQGESLTTVMMGEAIDYLLMLDPELRLEPGGATSSKVGVGVWSSTGEPDQPVMSVITFGPGYYG